MEYRLARQMEVAGDSDLTSSTRAESTASFLDCSTGSGEDGAGNPCAFSHFVVAGANNDIDSEGRDVPFEERDSIVLGIVDKRLTGDECGACKVIEIECHRTPGEYFSGRH